MPSCRRTPGVALAARAACVGRKSAGFSKASGVCAQASCTTSDGGVRTPPLFRLRLTKASWRCRAPGARSTSCGRWCRRAGNSSTATRRRTPGSGQAHRQALSPHSRRPAARSGGPSLQRRTAPADSLTYSKKKFGGSPVRHWLLEPAPYHYRRLANRRKARRTRAQVTRL
jgi:hypothetical protein